MFTSWLKYWRKDMTDLQELRGRRENRKQNCWLISAWSPYKAKYLFVHAVATLGIFLRVFLGGLALSQFFFFRFSITIFSFSDFSSNFFFFSFFFLLESNVMNTVLDPVSILDPISVPIYFDILFQGVSGFLKKIKKNVYLYFLIQHKTIDPNK